MENQNVINKYASQRRNFLENYAPKAYKAMLESGSLESHLMSVQETVFGFVEGYTEKFKRTDEYRNSSPENAIKLLNMTVLEAEEAAYRMWVTNNPENEDGEENV